MRYLRQSTSVDLPIGPFLDETDGFTVEAALTLTQPDIRLKKNGANWAQKAAAQTLTHEENGFYEVTLDATDTNTLGQLRLAVHETGSRVVLEDFMVLAAGAYDALIGAPASNRLVTTVSVTSTAGTTAHVKVQMTDSRGALIDIHALDAAATCAVTVIQDGGATQFSLATGDFGAPSSSVGWFEADYANPAFTADRGYTAEVTVVANGITYQGSTTFFTVP